MVGWMFMGLGLMGGGAAEGRLLGMAGLHLFSFSFILYRGVVLGKEAVRVLAEAGWMVCHTGCKVAVQL